MIRQIHSAGYDIPESGGHESNLMMVGPMLQTFLEDRSKDRETRQGELISDGDFG